MKQSRIFSRCEREEVREAPGRNEVEDRWGFPPGDVSRENM